MALKGPRTGSYTNSVSSKYNFNRLPVADFVTAQTPIPPDEYFKNTTLLLSTSVTNGAQNNTFLDSSNNNFTITRNGNATQGTYSPYSHMGWSNYFDGTGDYLTAPSNAGFDFGTGDFTVEGWMYPTYTANLYFPIFSQFFSLSLGVGSWGLFYRGSSYAFELYYDGQSYSSSTALTTAFAWNHVAVSRSSGTIRFYINGVLALTQSYSGSYGSSSNPFEVGGSSFNLNYGGTGYISNVRVVKGTALYTANFTPPTSPLTAIANTSLLTCQSNRFIDNSTNNFTITRNGDVSIQPFAPFNPTGEYSTTTVGGSAYFDGTGDFLTVTNISIGTDTFTHEAWIYPTASSYIYPIVVFTASDLLHTFGLANDPSGPTIKAIFSASTRPGSGNSWFTAPAIPLNTWTHIAFVRSGTTVSIYVNGVSQTLTTTNGSNTSRNETTNITYIGSTALGEPFLGYISNARVVKGIAVYTGNFTPPAAPILVSGSSTPYTNTSNVNTTFAAANTSLLCNFTNAGIFDATARNILETVGNAQASQTQTKFGASSMYFDGTGDYLLLPATPNLSFGTGDFTVEFWVRFDSIAADRGFLGSGAGGYDFVWRTSTGLNLGRINTAFDNTFSWSPSTGIWYHVAYARSGTSLKVFVDGAQVGTTATNSNSYDAATSAVIGGSTTADRLMNGYLDDFRITKGVARYTANFTPPSRTFALR